MSDNKISPFVLRERGKNTPPAPQNHISPLAKPPVGGGWESSIVDDAELTPGPFGPPTEDEFSVAGQTEEG